MTRDLCHQPRIDGADVEFYWTDLLQGIPDQEFPGISEALVHFNVAGFECRTVAHPTENIYAYQAVAIADGVSSNWSNQILVAPIAAVPEPSQLLGLLFMSIGLIWMERRRR